MERFHTVAGGCDHALDLVVFAFADRQAQGGLAAQFAGRSSDRRRLVMQFNACEQMGDKILTHRVFQCHLIELGRALLARTPLVDELTVIGQQHQSGGVLIQTTHALHVAQQHLRRQQGEHRRVEGRLVRTLVARGLVQHQVSLGAVVPALLTDLKFKAG